MQNQGFGPKMKPSLNVHGRWVFQDCEGTVFWFASFRSMASALGASAMYFLALEKAQLEIVEEIADDLEAQGYKREKVRVQS